MPGRDYEIFLFKLDFCPAPNREKPMNGVPNTKLSAETLTMRQNL
ncbi:hypothetical protein [Staphylococcus marylandisciuri]|nr:hypothetical protein [Staphylococcus marylandisciuri]